MSQNRIVVIIGRKGFGKSTRARSILAPLPKTIAIDPMREYPGAIAYTYDQAVEYLGRVKDGPICRLSLQAISQEEELALVALAVHGDPRSAHLPGFTIAIDEADRLCSPQSMPEPLSRAVNYGRHFGIDLVFVSRRPRRLHRDITAMADEIHIGATQEPADLDYLADFTDRATADRAAAITRPGDFVTWYAAGPSGQNDPPAAASSPAADLEATS